MREKFTQVIQNQKKKQKKKKRKEKEEEKEREGRGGREKEEAVNVLFVSRDASHVRSIANEDTVMS